MTAYRDLVAAARADERTLVRVEREGVRARVTLCEPARLNPLSAALTMQLQDALEELVADAEVRTIVLTGEDPAFSAGGDLEMIASGSRAVRDAADPSDTTEPWRWIRRQFGGIVRTIAGAEQAFVAAINGPAAGVGLAFALACDVLIASDRALLVPAFGRLGLVPEVGTSWLMTRRLGYHGALAVAVEGRPIAAEEAARLGLVQQVCPHERLLEEAHAWCERVEALPPHLFPMTKRVLRGAADMSWHEALTMEEFAEPNVFSVASVSEAADAIRRS
ncbi:MAG TPA: enoyl-CoA hydratase/isomerase family protein [Solirubrobacteraceae bacterium]